MIKPVRFVERYWLDISVGVLVGWAGYHDLKGKLPIQYIVLAVACGAWFGLFVWYKILKPIFKCIDAKTAEWLGIPNRR